MPILRGVLMNLFLSLNAKRTLGILSYQFFMRLKFEILNTSSGIMALRLKSIGARHNDKVDKWREALAEVGNIHGQHVER